jgi:hypothetical protein
MVGSTVRFHGTQALRSRIEAHRQPVAGHGRTPEVIRAVGDRRRQHDAGGSRRERELDPLGRVDAAGHLERYADARRDGSQCLEVGRRTRPRAVEVDEMDDPCALGHEPFRDPVGAVGRRADPGPAWAIHDPRSAALEVDSRMTHTRSGPGREGGDGSRSGASRCA